MERCHTKSFSKRVVLHQGQLDVPSVKDCTLFGQNILGEYACDLKQGEMKEKLIVWVQVLIYLFIGEDSLLRVDLINCPHHFQKERL